jgi:glycosyl hydrolase family 43
MCIRRRTPIARRSALAALLVLLATSACASSSSSSAEPGATPLNPTKGQRYLFSYFKGNGEDGLHLAYSEDGLAWRALNDDRPYFHPTVGKEKLTRDPSIVRGPDGIYHMVWTAGWNEQGFGYAQSRDLITWTSERYVPVMSHEPTALNTWAPEIFYDSIKTRYQIVWASTIPGRFPGDTIGGGGKYNHRLYYTTTKDFRTFEPAKLLYDKGFSVIDADIIKDGTRYVMFLKDERERPPQKNIRLAYAERPEGPWSQATRPITGDYWAEGPTALRVGDEWILYFDRYRDHRYGALASTDLASWEDVSAELALPDGLRHGTAFAVPRADAERLLANERRMTP